LSFHNFQSTPETLTRFGSKSQPFSFRGNDLAPLDRAQEVARNALFNGPETRLFTRELWPTGQGKGIPARKGGFAGPLALETGGADRQVIRPSRSAWGS